MPVDLAIRITVESYDVQCWACGWTARLKSGQLEQVNAHHSPVLLAMRSRLDGGPAETWVCRKPRPLR